jgi:hypothetical protein
VLFSSESLKINRLPILMCIDGGRKRGHPSPPVKDRDQACKIAIPNLNDRRQPSVTLRSRACSPSARGKAEVKPPMSIGRMFGMFSSTSAEGAPEGSQWRRALAPPLDHVTINHLALVRARENDQRSVGD